MITQNVSTLKIHKLTKEQYDRELAAGRIDPNALYFTTNEKDYTTKDELAAIEERVAALEAAVAMLRTLDASEA